MDSPTLSVIIPAWREGDRLIERVQTFAGLPGVETITVLAEGDDETEEPDRNAACKIVRAEKGRASQMNCGAEQASGKILLFLHADTTVEPTSLEAVQKTLADQHIVGGAYRLKIGGDSFALNFFAAIANIRSRLFKSPYGDQAIFVRKEIFDRIGGYDDVPMLEDVRLVDRMKKEGSIVIIDNYATTSPRRWEASGVIKNTLRNWAIMIAYRLGASPERLSAWYYR